MSSRQLFISQLGACTRTINAEIKKQIIEVGAVRTGRMKNTTKVKVGYDFGRDIFFIKDVNSQFYYKFVDEGTRFIEPRFITDKTFNRPRVQEALDKVYDKWADWYFGDIIDRQFK